ncbi:hypothetical protein PIB30_083239 [Stylosanthes scabra]|uniref:Uncharacterized protein n=1 Tax=Stylosanthes scabra TaxID=79078 RepID=A0ABU6VQQ1_9FABA|nr:hypothetical protein [Stylosanthes scabra]
MTTMFSNFNQFPIVSLFGGIESDEHQVNQELWYRVQSIERELHRFDGTRSLVVILSFQIIFQDLKSFRLYMLFKSSIGFRYDIHRILGQFPMIPIKYLDITFYIVNSLSRLCHRLSKLFDLGKSNPFHMTLKLVMADSNLSFTSAFAFTAIDLSISTAASRTCKRPQISNLLRITTLPLIGYSWPGINGLHSGVSMAAHRTLSTPLPTMALLTMLQYA